MISSTIANMQEQRCYTIANSAFANVALMETDKDLIEALMAHTRKTPTDIARTAGLAVTTITRPLNKDVNYQLSKPTLDKLKSAFPDFPGWPEAIGGDAVIAARAYLSIEVLPSFAGMGGGGSGEGDHTTALVERALIEDILHGRASDFLVIDVRGESMQPMFYNGDQLLVDKRDCNPVQPGAFALWDGDGYVVKMVERAGQGRYRIWSANPQFSSKEIEAEETRIMGRPVWFGRRL